LVFLDFFEPVLKFFDFFDFFPLPHCSFKKISFGFQFVA